MLVDVGLDFKAPPSHNLKQWEKVRILVQNGYTFHSCGCGGAGKRPRLLNQVSTFLAEKQQEKEASEQKQRAALQQESKNNRLLEIWARREERRIRRFMRKSKQKSNVKG
jgi:hypothetical protein